MSVKTFGGRKQWGLDRGGGNSVFHILKFLMHDAWGSHDLRYFLRTRALVWCLIFSAQGSVSRIILLSLVLRINSTPEKNVRWKTKKFFFFLLLWVIAHATWKGRIKRNVLHHCNIALQTSGLLWSFLLWIVQLRSLQPNWFSSSKLLYYLVCIINWILFSGLLDIVFYLFQILSSWCWCMSKAEQGRLCGLFSQTHHSWEKDRHYIMILMNNISLVLTFKISKCSPLFLPTNKNCIFFNKLY